jgi:hypothetical protein
MKSQIKDIVIGIFAVIGFTAIVMGFNNPAEPQQVTYGTPESHVWELTNVDGRAYAINKVTGDIKLATVTFIGSNIGGLREYKSVVTPYGEKEPVN